MMKKRKGLFLLDALLGLLILSSLAVALYPLLGQAAYLADWASKRGRMVGESMYVMDDITEHLRNDLKSSRVGPYEMYQQDRYTYYAYNEKNKESPYTLYIDNEKLYLENHRTTDRRNQRKSGSLFFLCSPRQNDVSTRRHRAGACVVLFLPSDERRKVIL